MSLKKARKALKVIAMRDGISVEEVRKKIEEAIDAGMASTSPAARSFWDAVPRKGARPTPEEVICYLAEIAGNQS